MVWLTVVTVPSCTAAASSSESSIEQLATPLITAHPGQSGLFILEKGETALLSRAWMVDHATTSIDVQYFIWSTDNIGILAAESLLRAADRGVHVRVIVDDLLIDADNQTLLALAHHPQVEIRVYNPRHSVGVSTPQRIKNLLFDFRASNQRMHDKTVTVDGLVAITGGRNMADEYYDYDQEFNFRDRDALLMGPAVKQISASFNRFWQSPLTAPVGDLLGAEAGTLTDTEVTAHHQELHRYANNPENFEPAVRAMLEELSQRFAEVAESMVWSQVRYISDLPGKNDGSASLGGGGNSTDQLVAEVKKATRSITIQSPYLVIPEGGKEIFRQAIKRGVSVRVCTNSLAATDNLLAFSGYANQRQELVDMGIQLFEYRPYPNIQKNLIDRFAEQRQQAPLFAIHAKSMVIDSKTLYIGTFNLDPRSANLNTEVGILVTNRALATEVEQAIAIDMAAGNSWQPTLIDTDQQAPWDKRLKVKLLKLLPLEAVL